MKMVEEGIPSRWGTFKVMFSWYYTTCTDPSNLTNKIVTDNSRPFVSEKKDNPSQQCPQTANIPQDDNNKLISGIPFPSSYIR